MRDSALYFIRSLVYDRSRINLGPGKRQLVSARAGERLRGLNVPRLPRPAGENDAIQLQLPLQRAADFITLYCEGSASPPPPQFAGVSP